MIALDAVIVEIPSKLRNVMKSSVVNRRPLHFEI